MIEPTNNEIGQAWAVYALGELAEAWPRRCDFNAMDLERAVGIGPRSESEQLFEDLFQWLGDSGFVRIGADTEGAVYGVSLTAQGLDTIGKSLRIEKTSVGSRLKGLASQAASETGRATISETVGQIIGAAARNFL